MIVETLVDLDANPLAIRLAGAAATPAELAEAEAILDEQLADEIDKLAQIDERLAELRQT